MDAITPANFSTDGLANVIDDGTRLASVSGSKSFAGQKQPKFFGERGKGGTG